MAEYGSMERPLENRGPIYLFYKWKRILIVNTFIITAIGIIYAFTRPLEFKSTAVIMIPPEGSTGLGSLFGEKSSIGLGAKLFGMSNTSEDMLLGILNSRTALENVINKFSLGDYYKIKDGNIDKILQSFVGDLSFSVTQYAMIEISVINESPQMSADIANYFVKLVDSVNIGLNIQNAHNSRLYIENRYLNSLANLKQSEDSLLQFQKKYGIFAVPQQFDVAVKAAGELESKLLSLELEEFSVSQVVGASSPQVTLLREQISEVKRRINEIKNSGAMTSNSNIFLSFKDAPFIAMTYLRYYRDVELNSKIQAFLLPMYEQAKIDEQKHIATIQILDSARPPRLKHSPKRLFLILVFVIIGTLFTLLLILSLEKIDRIRDSVEPLDAKLRKMLIYFKKLYFLRS